MNGCSFQQDLRQNLGWFLSSHWKTLFLSDFILKPTERAQVLPKNGTSYFQNSPPFERSAKFGFVLALTLENAFSQRFHFEANRKSIVSSKKVLLNKYLSRYIPLTNQISLPDCLFEILSNMCIVIICCPVCDVMNFEINFLIKWLFNITKKSDKNMNISRMKRAFNMK